MQMCECADGEKCHKSLEALLVNHLHICTFAYLHMYNTFAH